MLSIIALVTMVAAPPDPCGGLGTAMLVRTDKHRLFLCEQNRTVAEMPVALGQGGIGKRTQGDQRVPLGEYPLGSPVPSVQFHIFIPLGYPTPDQVRAGYTGSALGVHGPQRGYETPASTTMDWTAGCIAVGTDREIDRVADWIRAKRVRRIVITTG
jgi:murein L,D-transpeptidase YafK